MIYVHQLNNYKKKFFDIAKTKGFNDIIELFHNYYKVKIQLIIIIIILQI